MLCVNVSQHIRTPSGSSPTLIPSSPPSPPKVFMPVGSYNINYWYKSPPNRLTNTTFSCESNSHSLKTITYFDITDSPTKNDGYWTFQEHSRHATYYNFRTNSQQSTNFDQAQSDRPQGSFCGHSESVSDFILLLISLPFLSKDVQQ